MDSKQLRHAALSLVILVSGVIVAAADEHVTTDETITVPTLSTDGIWLQCNATSMIVVIPTDRLTDNVNANDLRWQNENSPDCTAVRDGNTFKVETGLTECGTTREQTEGEEIYTNVVVNVEPADGISRQYLVDIPAECSYNRSGRVDNVWYQLSDYLINKDLKDESDYAFQFDIYEDSAYTNKYEEYPITIGLNKPLYFAASISSPDATLDLSIQSCRATPSSNYYDENFIFIDEGVKEDDSTEIECLAHNRIGVTTDTFRFVHNDGLVYIHCDLFVCDGDGEEDNACHTQCPDSPDSSPLRRKRDISNLAPAKSSKQLTRGPIRIAPSASSFDGPQKNLWGFAMITMGSVVVVLLAALVIILRKQAAAPSVRRKDDEASVGLIVE